MFGSVFRRLSYLFEYLFRRRRLEDGPSTKSFAPAST